MNIKVKLDDGAFMPEKAHETDAGYDLRTPCLVVVRPHKSFVIDTGVHMLIPDGYVGMIKSKSGLNVNHGLITEGVIDAGYTGSIKVSVYNTSNEEYTFERGDKITQLVPLKLPKLKLEQVEEMNEKTERGENGFGSSGK